MIIQMSSATRRRLVCRIVCVLPGVFTMRCDWVSHSDIIFFKSPNDFPMTLVPVMSRTFPYLSSRDQAVALWHCAACTFLYRTLR
ncbi:hypothetical protein EDB19DRAFT_1705593 [Suillus lakei]|nr:hypothetical protein EDB19DRAFT_1705593 [Suillus lakei]